MSVHSAIIHSGQFCFSTLIEAAQSGATEALTDTFEHLKALGADNGLCPQTMAKTVVDKALTYDLGEIAKIVDPVVNQTSLDYTRAP